MKMTLFCIVLFFSSFNLEYREKWVCHGTLQKPGEDWCFVIVIKADTKNDAEIKFKKYLARKQKEYGGVEDYNVHLMKKLKDAIMIEP